MVSVSTGKDRSIIRSCHGKQDEPGIKIYGIPVRPVVCARKLLSLGANPLILRLPPTTQRLCGPLPSMS